MLMLVAIVMSFAIAGVYAVTKDTIEAAALQAQQAARSSVMPEAAEIAELPLEDGAPVDGCFIARDAEGNTVGYVSQVTVVGFGGEIEVTVGMDLSGAVTAISVGGPDFSETSGLGAKTREPAFTDQFRGASGLLVLKQNIDSVTGASVSSGAVVSGVNKALAYMTALLPQDPGSTEDRLLSNETLSALGAADPVWMGAASGIDGWWRTDGGYIVQATGFGEGPIAVVMAFDESGVVTGLVIGDENFMETPGRGDGVLAPWYAAQFVGRSGVQSYGDGLDAISGATVTSTATLAAINACMSFDPATGSTAVEAPAAPDASTAASVPAEEPASGETVGTAASAEPDVVSEATVAEEEPAPTPTPDAVSEASIPEEEPVSAPPTVRVLQDLNADAATYASVPEPTPTPEPTPDAVSEASIPEE